MARRATGVEFVSDFGDFGNDDAFDTEPPDPEQVAIRLRQYRRNVEPSLPAWHELSDAERARDIGIMVLIVAWLRRQGAIR